MRQISYEGEGLNCDLLQKINSFPENKIFCLYRQLCKKDNFFITRKLQMMRKNEFLEMQIILYLLKRNSNSTSVNQIEREK